LHFGIVSPPVPGHINPFGALGRELIERGHRVTLFHMQDLESSVRAEGLDFVPIGEREYPKGSLPESLAILGKLKGLSALKFTIRAVAKTTEMMLREGPEAIRASQVSMLLVDQTEAAGGTIAERLGIPFITVCNALALNREPDVPPPFTSWRYRTEWWARARNALGYSASDRLTRPISEVVAGYRRNWRLAAHRSPDDSFSRLAQISQQPASFDFPRQQLPSCFHYVGPLRKASGRQVPFPWERLDGRPLIYASLGTLQNSRIAIFRCFAEACSPLDVQLVITHGGGLDAKEASSLPADTIVVSYAPQLELLSRARLTLTHAGLNTVLDSLTYGVPLVAIPITYEQPAIAARILYSGVGETISLARLNPGRLRNVIAQVLSPESPYHANAHRASESIRTTGGGAVRAAEIILGSAARANGVS
jgi:MGT family glycosyltransferase